jgi:signal transduction histidine kinase
MRSLRARLIATTVLVAAVAVTASALFSRRVVTNEYQRLVLGPHPVDLAPIAHALGEAAARPSWPADADARLAVEARRLGRALLLIDPGGRTMAASSASLRQVQVRFGPAGAVRLESGPNAARGFALELRSPPRVDVRAGDRTIGTLLVLPEPDVPQAGARPFQRTVDRGFVLGGLLAIAIGAALMGLLASRITGPVEALTSAVRKMEGGDLSPRVAVHGNDEVATLARAFNGMAGALGRAQALRRQLTADVAHELRTPLANLRGQIEALQDGLLAPDAAALASLHEEVAILARLVDDLQQLADAESGALRLEAIAVPVRAALENTAAGFQLDAAARTVTIDVDADAALTARVDPVRLGQILRNLVANALTHTPAGGRIRLTASREGATVAFAVEDTGTGIAPEHLPHVFERFYRADPSRTRATGGAGLGLAVVRQLVIAHGGTVAAASEPGRGTRMTFTLPAA